MISHLHHNCCAITEARELRFLIDGSEYFEAFMEVAERAEHQLLIVAWDVDSRTNLTPDKEKSLSLGDFLGELCRKKPSLRIRILCWDSNFFFMFNRDLLMPLKYGVLGPPGMQMYLVKDHPSLGCHHQKIIVADDSLAMTGGFDLTRDRWDTSSHLLHDRRRKTAKGDLYIGTHDVHALVSGGAAAALGDAARHYWKRGTGESLNSIATQKKWPAHLEPHFQHVFLSISKTAPSFPGRIGIREIETLYMESILAAKKLIYIENQYFTADSITKTLCKILHKQNGPRVLIVTPKTHFSFLELAALEQRRFRCLRKLQKADRFGHLKIVTLGYKNDPASSVKVHSKLMIIDDRFITVGSANLNNRSMGLDDEININVESGNHSTHGAAIAHLRNRLLSEFIGLPQKLWEQKLACRDLFEAIEEEHLGLLESFDVSSLAAKKGVFPIAFFGDPHGPLDHDRIYELLTRRTRSPLTRHPVLTYVTMMLTIGFVAIVSRYFGLAVNLESQIGLVRNWLNQHHGNWLLLFGASCAPTFLIPVTLILALSSLAAKTPWAYACSFLGLLLNATLAYGFGNVAYKPLNPSESVVRNLMSKLEEFFKRPSVLAVMSMRILPVAPYAIIGFASGFYHVPFKKYLAGTLLGLLPGVTLVYVFYLLLA